MKKYIVILFYLIAMNPAFAINRPIYYLKESLEKRDVCMIPFDTMKKDVLELAKKKAERFCHLNHYTYSDQHRIKELKMDQKECLDWGGTSTIEIEIQFQCFIY